MLLIFNAAGVTCSCEGLEEKKKSELFYDELRSVLWKAVILGEARGFYATTEMCKCEYQCVYAFGLQLMIKFITFTLYNVNYCQYEINAGQSKEIQFEKVRKKTAEM